MIVSYEHVFCRVREFRLEGFLLRKYKLSFIVFAARVPACCLLLISHYSFVHDGLSLYYHSKHLQSTAIIYSRFQNLFIRFVSPRQIYFKNALNLLANLRSGTAAYC